MNIISTVIPNSIIYFSWFTDNSLPCFSPSIPGVSNATCIEVLSMKPWEAQDHLGKDVWSHNNFHRNIKAFFAFFQFHSLTNVQRDFLESIWCEIITVKIKDVYIWKICIAQWANISKWQILIPTRESNLHLLHW